MQYAASLTAIGAYLVELFPVLKHLPNFLAPWKAEIQRRSRGKAAVNADFVRVVQHDILNAKTPESAPPSLCKHLLKAGAVDPPSFSLLSDRASLFGMGSDTTADTLLRFSRPGYKFGDIARRPRRARCCNWHIPGSHFRRRKILTAQTQTLPHHSSFLRAHHRCSPFLSSSCRLDKVLRPLLLAVLLRTSVSMRPMILHL
jgi:hypothetical protein